ncbi:hypothetical protein [Psychrobacter immobilis]|uniref:hypothetical protein n=1 Tax=Psychrobacter immobilis TaxID=498 RepID=UPI00191AFB82|nr:hypothetical protein [Psychrobacter immobilis]
MKTITYGLDAESVAFRRLNIDGNFMVSQKERYTVNLFQDLTPPLNDLESAILQVDRTATRRAAMKDKHRSKMVTKFDMVSNRQSVYLASFCAIGSLISTRRGNSYDLKEIANAVQQQNECWSAAIDSFNKLFVNHDTHSSKKAVRHTQGRIILSQFLVGLKLVSDLVYESYNLKKKGLFVEAIEIEHIMADIGIMQTDAYMLLLSPNHPEHKIIVEILDEHESCHELCRGENGNWIMINKHKIKNIDFSQRNTEVQANAFLNETNRHLNVSPLDPDINVGSLEAKPLIIAEIPPQTGGKSLNDFTVDGSNLNHSGTDVQDCVESIDGKKKNNEVGDENKDTVGTDLGERYSTKRVKPEIRRKNSEVKTSHINTNILPNKANLNNRGLFYGPSNASSMNFSVDDI